MGKYRVTVENLGQFNSPNVGLLLEHSGRPHNAITCWQVNVPFAYHTNVVSIYQMPCSYYVFNNYCSRLLLGATEIPNVVNSLFSSMKITGYWLVLI